MLAAVLSYFDAKIGPKILIQASELPDYFKFDHIPLLMDFYSGDFFIHEFGDLKTANLMFNIPSPIARGKEESCMISIILLDGKLQKLSKFKQILEIFITEFKKIEDAFKGLRVNSDNISGSKEKFDQIKELFDNFFNSLPKEKAVFKIRNSRILIFGLKNSGKSTIIKCLREKIFDSSTMKKEVNLRKYLLGNLSITSYNFSEKNYFSDVISVYLNETDGVVFVIDASDVENYDKAKNELHQLNNFPETYHLPLLIMLNKTDLRTPKIDSILKELELHSLRCKNVKYFQVSALKNKGITESFMWIANEILTLVIKNPIIYFS